MVLSKRDCTDGYRWRCPRRGCTGTNSVREGSFAARSHLSFHKLLLLIYHWCFGVRLTTSRDMLNLSEHTVVDWFQYMRDECTWKILQDPVSITSSTTYLFNSHYYYALKLQKGNPFILCCKRWMHIRTC